MEVDWVAKGDQNLRVRRACSSVPPAESANGGDYGISCTSGSADSAFQYKDCKQTWDAKADVGVNKDTAKIEEQLGSVSQSNTYVTNFKNALISQTF